MSLNKISNFLLFVIVVGFAATTHAVTFEKYDHLDHTYLKRFFNPDYNPFDEVLPYPDIRQVVYNDSVHLVGTLTTDFTYKIHILNPKKENPDNKFHQRVMASIDIRDFNLNPQHTYLLSQVKANKNVLLILIRDETNDQSYIFRVSGLNYNIELLTLSADYNKAFKYANLTSFGDTWVEFGALAGPSEPLIFISENNGSSWNPKLLNKTGYRVNIESIQKLKDMYFIKVWGVGKYPDIKEKIYSITDLSEWNEIEVPGNGEVNLYATNNTLIAKRSEHPENDNDQAKHSYWYSENYGISWIKIDKDLTSYDLNNFTTQNSKLHMTGYDESTGVGKSVYLVADKEALHDQSSFNYDYKLISDRDISLHETEQGVSMVTSNESLLYMADETEHLKYDMDFFTLN